MTGGTTCPTSVIKPCFGFRRTRPWKPLVILSTTPNRPSGANRVVSPPSGRVLRGAHLAPCAHTAHQLCTLPVRAYVPAPLICNAQSCAACPAHRMYEVCAHTCPAHRMYEVCAHTWGCRLCAHCAVGAYQMCTSFGAHQVCAPACALTDHLVRTAPLRCARCARAVRCARFRTVRRAACAHGAYPCMSQGLLIGYGP